MESCIEKRKKGIDSVLKAIFFVIDGYTKTRVQILTCHEEKLVIWFHNLDSLGINECQSREIFV